MEKNFSEHVAPTDEISLDLVKKRAITGVFVLTGRTFIFQVINFISTSILLPYFLEISEYGVFWAVSAIVAFFGYFSDIGLAAALIQKKQPLKSSELRTTFFIQQLLVLSIVVLIFLLTPFFQGWYNLSKEGVYLLWALAFSFFLNSLKTIPSVILERKIQFHKLVVPQIVEAIVYNVIVVIFAWKGFGILSFVWAVLARSIVGVTAIYIIQPWMPGFTFDKVSLKKLFRFGIPYQLNTFLAMIKDDGVVLLLTGILGTGGLGLVVWAKKWSEAPLRFFMDVIIKVTFPAFARMQSHKKSLENALTASIFFICLIVFPTVIGLILIAPMLIEIFEKYERWRPALVPLMIFGVSTIFSAITTQLTNLFNAIGKIKIHFKFMAMWTLLTWILVPTLSLKYGIIGTALGYSLVSATSVVAIFIAYQYVHFSLWKAVLKPLIASSIMGIVVFLGRLFLPISILALIIVILLGIVSYTIVSLMLMPELPRMLRKIYLVLKS